MTSRTAFAAVCVSSPLWMVGCAPTVTVATDEPIKIQLDITITQDVRVRLDDDVEALITDNPDLF